MSKSTVQILNQIFISAVNSVKPQQLIRSAICIDSQSGTLHIESKQFDKYHKVQIIDRDVFLFGAGKAIIGMCQEFLEQIDHTKFKIKVKGHLNIPIGSFVEKENLFSKYNVTYNECGKNNNPDYYSVKNTKELMNKLYHHVTQNTNPLIIGFISGGGSALLSFPIESISLQNKLNVITSMVKHGANIIELNSVRSCLSQVKHGKLAKKIFEWNINSELLTFIISDIIGDPIEMIASGPTVVSQSLQLKPENILQKYSIQFEDKINKLITNEHKEISLTNNNNLTNIIIGSNSIALNEAKEQAKSLGFKVIMIGSGLSGEARYIIQKFLKEINDYRSYDKDRQQYNGIVWLAGGEVTIKMDQIKDLGIGGRCQEMGLLFFDEMHNRNWNGPEIYCLFAGTDGQDGPTPVAGVQLKWPFHKKLPDNFKEFLINHDSYNFWLKYAPESLIRTGITGTNVMDIYSMMIKF